MKARLRLHRYWPTLNEPTSSEPTSSEPGSPLPAQSSQARRVVVTGGAGFLGSHLCEALVARGDTVVCVDDLSSGRLSNLEELEQDGRSNWVIGDVSESLEIEGPRRRGLPSGERRLSGRLPGTSIADSRRRKRGNKKVAGARRR